MELHDYQIKAKDMIRKIMDSKRSFLLAFDRGLGKTIVTLSLIDEILKEDKYKQSKFLLVVKASNIKDPWKNTLDNDFPSLKCKIYHGTERIKMKNYNSNTKKEEINTQDDNIIITTYQTLYNDIDYFNFEKFSIVVFDELHNIINAIKETNLFQKIREIENIKRKLVLTGSPVNNRYEEYDDLKNFINDKDEIKDASNIIILNKESYSELLKLPPKEEYDVLVPTHGDIANECEVLMSSISRYKWGKILPFLSMPKGVKFENIEELSYKAQIAIRIVKYAISRKQKVIIFSNYTYTLDVLSVLLMKYNIEHVKYNGGQVSNERERRLDLFRESNIPVMLNSLKAGAEGINIQEASVIVLFETWWNPQKLEQAIDRAYRQGQKKKVIVFRLRYKEEEKVISVMKYKTEMIDEVFKRPKTESKPIKFEEKDFCPEDTKIISFFEGITIGEAIPENDNNEQANKFDIREAIVNANKNRLVPTSPIYDEVELQNDTYPPFKA